MVATAGLIVYDVKVSFFRGNFILREKKEADFPRQKNRVERKFRNFSFSNEFEILGNRVTTISKPFLTVQKLNRVAHKPAFTLSPNSFMVQEEIKTYKLAFNLISSPDNASFHFPRVFNFDFFFLANMKIQSKK